MKRPHEETTVREDVQRLVKYLSHWSHCLAETLQARRGDRNVQLRAQVYKNAGGRQLQFLPIYREIEPLRDL